MTDVVRTRLSSADVASGARPRPDGKARLERVEARGARAIGARLRFVATWALLVTLSVALWVVLFTQLDWMLD